MNSIIEYMFYDTNSRGKSQKCIISGSLTSEMGQRIQSCLYESGIAVDGFVPCLVGLPGSRPNNSGSGLGWFEWRGVAALTEEPPTVNITADQLVSNFMARKGNWGGEGNPVPHTTLEQVKQALFLDNRDVPGILKGIQDPAEKDAAVLEIWNAFEDVPMDPETEEMEEPFLHFPAHTDRETIWHWFDDNYSKGVYALLYGDGEDRTEEIAHTYAEGKRPGEQSETEGSVRTGIYIESINVDGKRVTHRFPSVERMLADLNSEDPSMGDNEIMLVVHDGAVAYSSRGRKRQCYDDTVRTSDITDWFASRKGDKSGC